MLKRVFPRPDLVIFLDAPAEMLFARKGESTIEALDQKRREFLALRSVFSGFHVVDATQPTDAVVRDVVTTILAAALPPRPADRAPAAGDDLQETAA
jgi:thymidylate kinase